jgi:hypothetical protein
MSLLINSVKDNRCVFLSDKGETLPVDLPAVAEPLSPDRPKILPVTRWESVQFSPTIHRQRFQPNSVPLPLFRTISEAHVSERGVAFGRRRFSFHRVRRSRAGVRFRTTVRALAHTC